MNVWTPWGYLIPLWGRGGVVRDWALADEDLEGRWHILRANLNRAYAIHTDGRTCMHRHVMGCLPGDGLDVDHLNGDRLDNRRTNMEVVSHSENMKRRGVVPNLTIRMAAIQWMDARKAAQVYAAP